MARSFSPLYRWMTRQHAQLLREFGEFGPDWIEVAERCAAENIKDGSRRPPSPDTCRKTWWRVRTAIAAKAKLTGAVQAVKPTEPTMPVVRQIEPEDDAPAPSKRSWTSTPR